MYDSLICKHRTFLYYLKYVLAFAFYVSMYARVYALFLYHSNEYKYIDK